MKKIFLIFVLFLLIFTAGCSTTTCEQQGTSCCKSSAEGLTECATPEIAPCDDGHLPEFKGCSEECVPQWECPAN